MAWDQDEELRRLDAALREDETSEEETQAPPEEAQDEDLLEDEMLDQLLEDPAPAKGGVVYRNYSNGYGKQLRNYASGYRAYNTDRCDTDLEAYSEAVRQPKSGGAGLVALACLLTAGIVAVLVWWLIRYGGML